LITRNVIASSLLFHFWWRELAAGQSLNLVEKIEVNTLAQVALWRFTVAVGRTPNLSTERRTFWCWAISSKVCISN